MNWLDIKFTVTQAEVFWFISDKGPSEAQAIASGTKQALSTTRQNASALEKGGLLVGQGRPKIYSIAESPSSENLAQMRFLESLARSTWRLIGIEPA